MKTEGVFYTRIIEPSYNWAFPLTPRAAANHLILHHSAADNQSPEAIHSYHLSQGFTGIGYHYYIRKSGDIYRGRPEHTQGAHTKGFNSSSIAICFEGNFEEQIMPSVQITAAQKLITDIKTRYPEIVTGLHRDFDATACPGRNFPAQEIIFPTEPKAENQGEKIYTHIEDIPDWGYDAIKKLVDRGVLLGESSDSTEPLLNISRTFLRIAVLLDRLGLFDLDENRKAD